jgi:methyl-accepting chemotaxis protein
MNIWNNFKLGPKMIISFSIIIVLVIAVGLVGLRAFSNSDQSLAVYQKSNSLVTNVLEMRRSEKNYIMRGDAQYIKEVGQYANTLRGSVQSLETSFKNDQTVKIYPEMKNNIDAYEAAFNDYVAKNQDKAAIFLKWKELAENATTQFNKIQGLTIPGDKNFLQCDKVENSFYMMRIRAVYLLKNEGDPEWKDFQSALNTVKQEAQSLTETASGKPELAAAASIIQESVQAYGSYGDVYYKDILAQRNDNNVFVATARKIQGSADQSNQDYGFGGAILISSLAINQMEANQKSATYLILGLSVLTLVWGISIAVLTTRGITKPVNRIKVGLKKIADGDLTYNVNVKSKDEIGEIARSYDEMQKYLNRLVAKIKDNAVHLTSASDQLSTAARQTVQATEQVAISSQQMAKGAQEQANNAQETAKSIEQLSGAINQLSQGAGEQLSSVRKATYSITEVSQTLSQVAGNASQATEGTRQAADVARSGAEKAKLTLSGMDKIKTTSSEVAKEIEQLGARSSEIGKIVAVIDDIAAQTNLLALNAAIEAARAGDQGRGFAVVSDEVRKLAERTSAATKEIADLIASIQNGIEEANRAMAGGSTAVSEGYGLVVESGQALEQILKASINANTLVEQISAKAQQVNASTNELVKVIDSVGSVTEQNTTATEQMTSSAGQVSKAVETVAGIAEENSAATEEVSASAQEMNAQANDIASSSQALKELAASLEKSVDMFKTI